MSSASNECRYCKAWIRWARHEGRWKPFGTDAKVHNCGERWKAVKANGPVPRKKSTDYADAKRRAANDVEKPEAEDVTP